MSKELEYISCPFTNCDNNTGLDINHCMFGITSDLIKTAKSGKPMCEFLREEILKKEGK